MNTEFDTIESAQEFLVLLREAVIDASRDTNADIRTEGNLPASRRLDALRLVAYKLDKLDHHVKASYRLLNDLRSLRRLLLEERLESAPQHNNVAPRAVAI
jgi:hypothetical protein